MKSFLKLIILSFLLCSTSFIAQASDDNTIITSLAKHKSNGDRGHRTPPRQILCQINNESIKIDGEDTASIVSFELYDSYGICIATFSCANNFITYIYSHEGEYAIQFETNEYIYSGYITI